jgi:hypothetical protein
MRQSSPLWRNERSSASLIIVIPVAEPNKRGVNLTPGLVTFCTEVSEEL